MQIYIGPFHPYLEDVFASEIRRFKSPDPLIPILVVVPSDAIRRRLQRLLAHEHGLNLVNFSILTFHQLSVTLCEAGKTLPNPVAWDDRLFEEIVRCLIRSSGTDPLFAHLEDTEGGAAALWQSLRDLKDARVDPDVALEALREETFGKETSKKLASLFGLFRSLQHCTQEGALTGYGDLAACAAAEVPASAFLKRFHHIVYYGFYDLTQVQIDLFHAVSRHFDVTLFFPLVRKQSAWAFSNRFFERYIEGLARKASEIVDLSSDRFGLGRTGGCPPPLGDPFEDPPSKQETKDLACTLISCFHGRDEVLTTAKEILRLTDDEGLAFHDIAVVSGDIARYLSPIKEVFQNHAIPYKSRCREPLMQYPYAKTLLLFLTLPLKDYPRADVIDLVSSPYFNVDPACPEGLAADKNRWDLISRKAGVTKGSAAWRRLSGIGSGRKAAAESEREQGALLLRIFQQLYEALEGLPPEGAWSDYASLYQTLLDTFLRAPSLEDSADTISQDARIDHSVSEILRMASALDRVAPIVSRTQFIQCIADWLMRETLPMSDIDIAGVSILSTHAARGLPFRCVFILGMNEGIFPRKIREDPFLPDRDRRILETVLGYKMSEKLAAYDEERLLLTLLLGASRERIYALSHRVDTGGSPAGPSWYLDRMDAFFSRQDVKDEKNIKDGEVESALMHRFIPRSLQDRSSVAPYHRTDLLLPGESALRHALSAGDPGPFSEALPFSTDLYHRGHTAFEQIESRGQLTAYDGLIEDSADLKVLLRQNGVSPTQMEGYARCPFQYFAYHLLALRPVEPPEAMVGLSPSESGRLCHMILKQFYDELGRGSYFSEKAEESHWRRVLDTVSAACFSQYQPWEDALPPLAWEALKHQIVDLLRRVIEIDLQQLSESGYRPVAFEVEVQRQMEPDWPRISGRIDRIDYHAGDHSIRAIDYKYTLRKWPKPTETNLPLSALRGTRLQPPLYLRLAEGQEGEPVDAGQRAAFFYFLAPNWPDGPLVVSEYSADNWEGDRGVMLRETISTLLSGMESGRFFIMPGDQCSHCEAAALCRKDHLPSLRRMERDPRAQALRTLQKKKPAPADQGRRTGSGRK
ncbi:MAG: PD-(D/E)XK nuclease family protein [Nitrospiria bacterium]